MSSEVLKRIENRANEAEQLIAVLSDQIRQLKVASGSVMSYEEEIKFLSSENENLKSEIENWKQKLIAAETKAGIQQIPVPTSGKRVESVPVKVEEKPAKKEEASGEKKKKKPEKQKKEQAKKEPESELPVHVGR